MNTQQLLQHCLLAVTLVGAAVCLATVLAYHFRNQIRELHERWLGLGPLGRVVSILAITVAVLYGGAKSPTNDPPIDIEGDAPASTNAPSEIVEGDPSPTNAPPHLLLSACCPPSSSRLTAGYQQLTTLTNWTARGAYSDWLRLTFPGGFAFPYGTNMLTGVTLMAYGTLRQTLIDPAPIAELPSPVSLEPGASCVTYGLTPSNSFLIAWQNACVNRSPTNCVDASIELFPSGVCSVRFGASQTDYPPTPPLGFVGSDQDNAWALAAFPDDYDVITNKGYEAWLDEDYVGVDEQNGHYKASITINQAPSTLHQAPLYLVCGPYKVVVTSPGTYLFPLEVFETYKIRTYPVALPLSITTDDGYRGNLAPALLSYACCSPAPTTNAQLPTPTQPSVSPVLTASRPRLALSAPHPSDPPEYEICEQPRLVISPTEIPLDQAVGTPLSIWCNVASTARRYCALISREFRLNFCNPSDAEIVAAEVEDLVEIMIDAPLGTCAGTITITDLHSCCECGSCTGPGCSCGCSCWRHSSYDSSPTNSPSATP